MRKFFSNLWSMTPIGSLPVPLNAVYPPPPKLSLHRIRSDQIPMRLPPTPSSSQATNGMPYFFPSDKSQSPYPTSGYRQFQILPPAESGRRPRDRSSGLGISAGCSLNQSIPSKAETES